MRKIIAISIILVVHISLHAQYNFDSLRTVLAGLENDTAKVKLMNSMAIKWEFNNMDSTIHYASKALDLATKMKYKQGIAKSTFALGKGYNSKQNPTARKYIETALKLFKGLGDDLEMKNCQNSLGIWYATRGQLDSAEFYFKEVLESAIRMDDPSMMSAAYVNVGVVAYQRGNNQEAIDNFFKAAELKERNNQREDLAGLFNNIAAVFYGMEDNKRGREYLYKAININTEFGNTFRLVKNYNNLMDAYHSSGDLDSAILVGQKAIEIAESQENSRNAYGVYLSMGNIYAEKEENKKALNYYLKAYSMYKDIGAHEGYEQLPISIAGLLLKLNKKEEAKPYIEEARRKMEDGDYGVEIPATRKNIGELYAGIGNYEKAYHYYRQGAILHDSLQSAEKLEVISEVEAKYETAEKEKEIQQLNSEKVLAEAEARQRDTLLIVSLGVLLLLIVVAVAIYLAYKQKAEINTKLEASNKEKEALLKEIHHRVKNNLQVISSLLNLQSNTLEDSEALDAIKEGQHRVKSIALIHQKLYQTENLDKVDFLEYAEQLVTHLSNTFTPKGKSMDISVDASNLQLDIDTAVPLGLIINELVTNSFKYGFKNQDLGEIKIDIVKNGGSNFTLMVKDNGIGYPENFDSKNSGSLGIRLVQILSRQLKGTCVFSSNEGACTTIQFVEATLSKQTA